MVGVYLDDAGTPKGFLLSNGRYSTIAAPGAPTTIPFGINDAGQIVGYTADDLNQTGACGFLLAKGLDGPFTPVNFPGAPKSVALGPGGQREALTRDESIQMGVKDRKGHRRPHGPAAG